MASKPITNTFLLTSILTFFIGFTANAQNSQWDDTSGKQYFMGNVGIGTNVPNYLFDIKGISNNDNLFRIKAYHSESDYISIANLTGNDGQFIPMIKGYHATDPRTALAFVGEINSNNDIANDNPVMLFDSRVTWGNISHRPLFGWANYGDRKMTMTADGSLGIGTTTTGSHKLAVEGSTGVRKVKVEATGWSDFVFEEDYALPTLSEIESYIQANNHLQGTPSAKEY
ncbi:hypothetical protein R9C00_16385 [Flammeovirgaceae bacterium SG7u.111]|nr:hypothetical protein [Flammeovirgaceae bacterium SG7u.132]WPO33281.1 hypothetical protein R9C00_16385 [Flammeovirgaceae bacterium SG7u.111]